MHDTYLFLAQQVIPQNGQQFFALVWRAAAIIAVIIAFNGLIMLGEGLAMDHRDGSYKKVLGKGALLFLVPTIVSMLIVMFFGVPAPVLNWG